MRDKHALNFNFWNRVEQVLCFFFWQHWAGFKWEETDKILSGEIQPRTLITTYYMSRCSVKPS